MNRFIKEELAKCRIAKIPPFSEDTTELIIKKARSSVVAPTGDLQLSHYYIIQVDESLINPCEWYKTIHGNWNNGLGPIEPLLKCEVIQFAGKMIKVDADGMEKGSRWTGWLPRGNVKVLQEVL